MEYIINKRCPPSLSVADRYISLMMRYLNEEETRFITPSCGVLIANNNFMKVINTQKQPNASPFYISKRRIYTAHSQNRVNNEIHNRSFSSESQNILLRETTGNKPTSCYWLKSEQPCYEGGLAESCLLTSFSREDHTHLRSWLDYTSCVSAQHALIQLTGSVQSCKARRSDTSASDLRLHFIRASTK